MDAPAPKPPSLAQEFTPELVQTLREGYGARDLKTDAIAGLTVAIVALPLSMAIAIASGVGPDRGLYTAIIGGFLVSLLGGSRYQIGGPAGAFIVLVAATVAQHGMDGLILATLLSGAILLVVGALRLGTYIRYIPYPVTVGFTAGIAVIIAVSQLKDALGLTLASEPAAVLPKLLAIGQALPTLNPVAAAAALATAAIILGLRRWRPSWPGMLLAIVALAATTAFLDLPIETIQSRFGGIPSTLPAPVLPEISLERITAVLPAALAFALLGGIESLLSAVVADAMSGRRHRSNIELVAQGAANIGSALFGGFCVTGTIARTATNVRTGARSPIAGMLHAAFLLAMMLLAAPLAGYIPLAALAAVLLVVAWNMAEKHEFATLLRASRGDAVVLLVTFGLVLFRDLTEGILAGFAIGTLLFLHRMATAVQVDSTTPALPYAAGIASDPDVVVHRISGAFFFGAAAGVAVVLDQLSRHPKAYVLDLSGVVVMDSTAATTIEGFARKARRRDAAVFIAGASKPIRRMLLTHGVRPPLVRFRTGVTEAIEAAHAMTRGAGADDAEATPLPATAAP